MELLRSFYNWWTCKDAMEKVMQGNNHFAFQFYQGLAKRRKYGGEMLFSPAALQIVLGMLWVGASEEGLEQIEKLLQLPSDRDTIVFGFKALYNKLLTMKFAIMNIATRIYTPCDIRLKRNFYVTCGRHFEVRIKPTDFLVDEGPVRDTINEWVRKNTMYKVDQIIKKQCVDDSSQILIVNGVNFECRMASPFLKRNITTGVFHVSSSETRTVQYLNQTASFRYGVLEEFNARILELPYQSPTLSLLIMLPNNVDGLSAMEKKLPNITVLDLLQRMHEHKVQTTIPKFIVLEGCDAADYIDEMGANSLMDPQSNALQEVSIADPPLTLTNLWQKTFFELIEEENHTVKPGDDQQSDDRTIPTKVFLADHPFVFMVVDKVSGLVILLGRVTFKDRFDVSMLRTKSGSRLLIPKMPRRSWSYYSSDISVEEKTNPNDEKQDSTELQVELEGQSSPSDGDYKTEGETVPLISNNEEVC